MYVFGQCLEGSVAVLHVMGRDWTHLNRYRPLVGQLRYQRVVCLWDGFERRCALCYPGLKHLTELDNL